MTKNLLTTLFSVWGIALLFPFGTKLSAQEPPMPLPIQGGQEPPPPPPEVQQGQDAQAGGIPGQGPEGDAIQGAEQAHQGDRRELMDLNIGLDVRAMQSPPRLAPGETGQLILLVSVAKGSRVLPGGQVNLKKSQGPLSFGSPVWDPVPSGKAGYQDSFLIRIPISVASTAKFGNYPARGDLVIKGVFRRQDLGSGLQKEKSPGSGATGLNRGFQGSVVVGKPWPKPPKRHRKAGKSRVHPTVPPQISNGSEGNSIPTKKNAAKPGPTGNQINTPLGLTQPKERETQDPGELEIPTEVAVESEGGHMKLLLGLLLAGLGVVGIGVIFLRKG